MKFCYLSNGEVHFCNQILKQRNRDTFSLKPKSKHNPDANRKHSAALSHARPLMQLCQSQQRRVHE